MGDALGTAEYTTSWCLIYEMGKRMQVGINPHSREKRMVPLYSLVFNSPTKEFIVMRSCSLWMSFCSGSGGIESTCQCRRHRLDPCVRKVPWRRKWQPTPGFLPMSREPYEQRSLVGYSSWAISTQTRWWTWRRPSSRRPAASWRSQRSTSASWRTAS